MTATFSSSNAPNRKPAAPSGLRLAEPPISHTTFDSEPTLGKIGNAKSFNGTSDFATISLGNPLPSSLTISAWIKPSSLTEGWLQVVGRQASSNDWRDAYALGVTDSGAIGAGGRNTTNTSPGVITTGTWHHIVSVITNTETKIYANGTLITTGSGGDIDTQSTKPDLIGAAMNENNTNKGEYFNGLIDDVKIYNRAITATEVSTLYNER